MKISGRFEIFMNIQIQTHKVYSSKVLRRRVKDCGQILGVNSPIPLVFSRSALVIFRSRRDMSYT